MKPFESWYTLLISDELWFELLHNYKEETIKKSAEKVYAQLIADGDVNYRPMKENRKHVYNILCKQPTDKVIKPWYAQEADKKEELKREAWKPVSENERTEWLKRWSEEVDKFKGNKIKPILDYDEIGQERLPRPRGKCEPSSPLEVIQQHVERANNARRKYFIDKNPEATQEQIQSYIDQFNGKT